MKTIAIIPAGGAGTRFRSHMAKQYLMLDSRPVIVHTLKVFQNSNDIDEIILALPQEDLSHMRRELVEKYGLTKVKHTVAGGHERQDSIKNCLEVIQGRCDIVLIHDAVRPFITEKLIQDVIETAGKTGAAIAAVKAKDTIKATGQGHVISRTVPRNTLWLAQTPQAFAYELIKNAYKTAYHDNFYGTDDAALVERLGKEVNIVEGSYTNFKITTHEDMMIAEALMQMRHTPVWRSGIGYDSHRLVEGRKLILGGEEIPYDKGLEGHSDADVLIHAICDALLGASGMKDIGRHFPDHDPEFKNISSMIILERVNTIIRQEGFFINNVDATVVMERPRLAPYIDKMISNVARVLRMPEEGVSIKAKTNEGMGFVGREEGVAVYATASLTERKKSSP